MDPKDGVDVEWSHYAVEARRNESVERHGHMRLPAWVKQCVIKIGGGARSESWFIAYFQQETPDLDMHEALDRVKELRRMGLLKRASGSRLTLSAKGKRALKVVRNIPK